MGSMNHRKHHTNAVKSKRGMGKFGGAKKRNLTKHKSRRRNDKSIGFSRIDSSSLHIVDEHYDEQIESQSEEENDKNMNTNAFGNNNLCQRQISGSKSAESGD